LFRFDELVQVLDLGLPCLKFFLQNFILSLAECNLLLIEDKLGFHGGELAAEDMFSITDFAYFAFFTAANQKCPLLL